MAHPGRLLTHLRAFLRPGGHLVVTTPNGDFAASRLPTLEHVTRPEELEARQYQPDGSGHQFALTPEDLRALFVEAGFAVAGSLLIGSPFLTGHLKLRHLSFLRFPALWHALERMAAKSPAPIRARLMTHQIMWGRAV